MATQVASIGVGKLSSTSKYVDYFLVEIYSDSGHTNKIGQATSSAQYDSTSATWKQKDYISFPGLVFGTTYFLRAYTVAPLSGALSAPTDFSTAAGSASAPGCTYPGTFTATLSGIGYVITPGSVPSDIDHFEAVWTVNDATVPSSTTMPYWTGQTTNGSIAFFAGGKPNDVIRAYVRAVNTSQQAQAWQAVGSSITISTVFGGAYTGTLNDGTLLGNGGPGVFSGSTGRLGIAGTQGGSNIVTAYGAGYGITTSGNAAFNAVDTTPTTGRNYSLYSGSGLFVQSDNAVGNRIFLNSSGQYGINGAPANTFEVFAGNGGSRIQGTNPYTYWDDSVQPRQFYQQSSGGTLLINDATAGAQRTWLTSGGGFGIGASPGNDFYYANSNRAYFQGSGPGVDLVDTQVGGRQYMALSGSGLAAGYTIYNSTNVNYPLQINDSGNWGQLRSPSYAIDTSGDTQVNGVMRYVDTGAGAQYALYATSGYPRLWKNGVGDFTTFNPSTGAMGLGGTYTGDWISIQGTPVIASDKNLYNQIAVSGKSRKLADVTDLSSSQGQNLAENPSFDLSANPGTGDLVAGWFTYNEGWHTVSVETNTTLVYSGSQAVYLSVNANTSIPANTSHFAAAFSRKNVPSKIGQKFWMRAKVRIDAGVSMPVGMQGAVFLLMQPIWSGGAGNWIVGNQLNSATGAYVDVFGTVTVPAAPSGQTLLGVQFAAMSSITNTTGGALSTPNGLCWDVRFDNIEVIRIADLGSDEVQKIGSIPPTFVGTMSYTSTTSSIDWSWNLTMYRVDAAMSTTSVNSSQNVTGLSAGTSYNFYPFYDEGSLSGTTGVSMVATGGSGSPSWAHSGTSRAWTQEQARADHVPLSTAPMAGSTASSGTGSGSGGGLDNGCHRKGTYVKERTRGVICVEEVRADDYLWSENDTWLRVKSVKSWIHDLWISIKFNCGQEWFASAGHPYILRDGTIKRGYELTLVDEVPCTTGITYPVSMQLVKEQHEIIKIEMEEPHTFYAATILDKPWVLSHNYNTA